MHRGGGAEESFDNPRVEALKHNLQNLYKGCLMMRWFKTINTRKAALLGYGACNCRFKSWLALALMAQHTS